MKIASSFGLLLAFFLVGVSFGEPEPEPQLPYYAANFGYQHLVPPQVDLANAQHHAQDGLGQYAYGYSSPTSQKSEVKTADGVTRGSYQYVDANNLIQTVNYISDSLGFRVAATNLPVAPGTEEQKVVQAVAAPAPYVAAAPTPYVAPTPYIAPAQVPYAPYAHYYAPQQGYAPNYHYLPHLTGAPVQPVTTPVVAAAPAPYVAPAPQAPVPVVTVANAPVITKYHSQDEFGSYAYGYNDGVGQTRDEVRDVNGNVKGSYNYIDINGVPQTVQYIADANGFQVQGTTVQVDNGQAPAPVEDTPEVAAAKVAHLKIYNDIKEVHASLPVVKATPVPVVEAAPVPVVKVAPVPVADVAPVPVETPIVSVAAEPIAEVKNDDIAVVGVTSSAVPYGLAPVHSVPYAPYAHYYAPQQGYYQAPVAPVVQTPVHAPVSYYAPHHGYQPTAYHAQPAVVPAPVTYQAAPVQAPVSAPAPGHSQFHAQDELGGYNYGYATAESSKQEFRTPDGIVRGTYSYIDANGIVQTVNYVSDAEGFKVAATNLPVGPTPAVAVAKETLVAVPAETPVAVAEEAPVLPSVYGYAPHQGYYQAPVGAFVQQAVHTPVSYYAPTHNYYQAAVPVTAPEATVIPVAPAAPAPTHSQFHAQDELGGYNYGYATPTSSKQEFKTPEGVVQGTYSYVDANGIVQTVNYVSDAEGFKVAATNLPRAPVAAPAPVPVAVVAPIIRQGKSEEALEEVREEHLKKELEEVQEARQEKQLLVDINGNVLPQILPVSFNTQIFDNIGVVHSGFVAPATYEVKNDDMEVLSATAEVVKPKVFEPKVVSAPVPYAPYAHYYAPQQGYIQAPVTPAVVQTPVHAPYAYGYAPHQGYYQAPVAPVAYQTAPVVAPVPAPSHSQFHAQDNVGGYNYGYTTDTSSKQEVRTPDGIVSGTYSYVDANGIIQTVNYVSDAEGFKVAATNLPRAPVAAPAPAVVAVAEPTLKVAEDQDDMEVIGGEDVAAVPTVPYAAPASYYAPHHVVAPYSPYAYGYAPHQAPVAPVVQHTPAHAPVAYYAPTHAYAQAAVPVAAPEATVVPVAAPASTHSQFHAQDEFGGYNYGYATPTSSKQEFRTPEGVVQGTYSYVDANGVVQTVNYVSDAEGFKVAATNLPRAPVAAPAPVPVAEVAVKPIAVVAPTVHAAPTPVAVVDFNAVPAAWLRTESLDLGTFDEIAVSKSAEEKTVEVEYDDSTDDMEIIAPVEETVANTVPYVAAPVVPTTYTHQAPAHYAPYAYGYAPHQGYYKAPVAPVVQHTPAHAPVSYYAPTHAYYQAAVPVTAPEATVVPVAPAAPAPQHSQFHAQGVLGDYNYGYATPTSSKQEFRSPDGVVQGTYSYVDANGVVQTVNYVSDAEGFKVAATNLPKAPVAAPAPVAVAEVATEPIVAPALSVYVEPTPTIADEQDDMEVIGAQPAPVVNTVPYVPYASPYAYGYAPHQGYYQAPATPAYVHAAPVHQPTNYYAPGYYQAPVAPVVAPAPVAAVTPAQSSQFHAQSELGEYNYGYSNANSAKQEFKTADGIVRGTYSYVDANGILQTVNYVSDAEGFKVAATNLPQAPVAAPYTPVAAPITPVVAPAAGEIDLRDDGDILDIRK